MASPSHVPVLLDRVVALLTPALGHEGAVLVDATLGLGGHSEAVLARCELARVVGIDRDPEALRLAGERLAAYGDRFTAVHATYDAIPEVLADLGLAHADGVLFDLGVSSMQLDVADRGFAYREDAPLDMRMDPTDRPDRGRRPQHLPAGRADPGAAGVRRGAVRAADRRRRRPRARHASRSPPRRGWSSCSTRRSPRPHGVPEDTRPSAPSRRCGWRSTTSSACCAAAIPAAIDVAGRRRPGGRGVLPLARGPAGQAGLRRRHPARRPARPAVRARRTASRPCAWSPAAPSAPTPTRSQPTPAPPRSGCAPSNGSVRT